MESNCRTPRAAWCGKPTHTSGVRSVVYVVVTWEQRRHTGGKNGLFSNLGPYFHFHSRASPATEARILQGEARLPPHHHPNSVSRWISNLCSFDGFLRVPWLINPSCNPRTLLALFMHPAAKASSSASPFRMTLSRSILS